MHELDDRGRLLHRQNFCSEDWFRLIVESRNILLLRRPLHGNSSAQEVNIGSEEAFRVRMFSSHGLELSP